MQTYGESSYQPEKDKNTEKRRYSLTTLNCIILFLVGFLGIDVISLLVNLILAATPLWEQVAKGETSISNSLWLNFFTYLILTPLMVFLLWIMDKEGFKKILKAFTVGHIYLSALFFFFILYIASDVYSLIEGAIEKAAGFNSSVNGNQSLIIAMMKLMPLPMLIETVILAPITEEITYRQGLFEAVRRKSRFWAYFVVCFVFGLIHVGNTLLNYALSDTIVVTAEMIWVEILAFPAYAIGGGILAACYEKNNSIAGSIITHAIQNLLACISIIVSANLSSSSSEMAIIWAHIM